RHTKSKRDWSSDVCSYDLQKAVETDAKIQAEKEAKEKKKREEAEKKEKEEHTLHMVAVGDNFFHDTVLADGQQESGVWSYDYIYENVKEGIEVADLAVVNQETPIVRRHDNTSGYPSFGMPLEGRQDIATLGYDVLTEVTQHY